MIPLIPLILGQLAQRAAPKVIDAIVDSIVRSPHVPASQENAQAIRESVEPIVRKATGAGRWPITMGALGSILAGLSTLAYATGEGNWTGEALGPALTGIITGGVTLFGLWRAGRAVR